MRLCSAVQCWDKIDELVDICGGGGKVEWLLCRLPRVTLISDPSTQCSTVQMFPVLDRNASALLHNASASVGKTEVLLE